MNDKNFITIQGWMITKLKLRGNELILYAMVFGFSQDGKTEFYGSQRYISSALGVSLPTANKLINSLLDKGLVKKNSESRYISVKESLTECSNNLNDSVKESLTNKDTKDKSIYSENVLKLFNFWNKRKGFVKHSKLTNDMKKVIESRLVDGYTAKEIAGVVVMYETILNGDQYWLNKRWTLIEFFKQGNAFKKMVDMSLKDYEKYDNKKKEY